MIKLKDPLKIALTRPVGQNKETADYARKLGFSPDIYPMVRLEPASNHVYEQISDALKNKFRSVVFTSKRGIEFFDQYLKTQNKKFTDVIGSRISFAMGPTTAQALKNVGITPHYPKIATSKHLADLIIEHNRNESCSPVAVLRTSIALGRPPTLNLREVGMEVQEFPVYETLANSPEVIDSLIKKLSGNQFSAVVFTSSYAVDVLFTKGSFSEIEVQEALKHTNVCSLGPTTTKTLKLKGIHVDVQSKSIAINPLLEEIREWLEKQRTTPLL